MEQILEADLPARFGGTPLDYQLVEEEDERGFTRLTILVNPAVQLTDEDAVITEMLAALKRRRGAAEISRELWQQAGAFRVRRQAARVGGRGKMMPLQVKRRVTSPEGAARPTASSVV